MKKILIIDDSASILKGLERRLALHYDVKTALSAKEALEILDDSFSAVIVDMNMPIMNGIEFVKKANETFSDIDFIMLSGNSIEDEAEELLDKNIIKAYLEKPCKTQDLKSAIEKG